MSTAQARLQQNSGNLRTTVADLVAASTAYTHALESAVEVLHVAGLDDHSKTVERIREFHRLHHAQIDALAGRLTTNAEGA